MSYHCGELDHHPPKPPDPQHKVTWKPEPNEQNELRKMADDGNKMAIYAVDHLKKANEQEGNSRNEICRLESEVDGLLSTIEKLRKLLMGNMIQKSDRNQIRISLCKWEEEYKRLIEKKKQEELKLQATIRHQDYILFMATIDPHFFAQLIEKQEAEENSLKEKETKEREENWRLYTLNGQKCIQ